MFSFLKSVFTKTGSVLGNKIRSLFSGKIDEAAIERLEELFFEADLGVVTTQELVGKVRELFRKKPNLSSEEILETIQKEILQWMQSLPQLSKEPLPGEPKVILIIGVNGNGKTTSIAKLSKYYKDQGKDVLVAAADTFRAAAIDQLELWANRSGVDLVKGKPQSDPAAVVFDAIQAAKSRKKGVVLVDTAGRLHTKIDLMQELQKIYRVSEKALPGAPHETLLVLDATIGQNGIDQALTFHQFTPLTGLILTKLDGTAKGGTAIAIQKKLSLPIRFIGIGEKIEDIKVFEPDAFVKSLFA